MVWPIDGQLYGRKYWQIDNVDVQDAKQYLNARLGIEAPNWGVYLWGPERHRQPAPTRSTSHCAWHRRRGNRLLVEPATYGIELRASF